MTAPEGPRDGQPEAARGDQEEPTLDELRERVAVVGSLPVADRPAVFADVNAAIVAELERMGGSTADPAVRAPTDESGSIGA